MDETKQEIIEQTTITLPFLDEEVPALYLADGRTYIPVCTVCRVLGIRADIHIRHWRKLVLWATAWKLPFQTARQGKRLVWCLQISQVSFLYSLFNWELVSPERRQQLRRATEEQTELADQAYQEMQQRYKAMRQALFTFLTSFADIDLIFQQYANALLLSPGGEFSLALSAWIDRGRWLFQEATPHARKMLQDQGALPLVDVIKVDADDNVIDTFSMPLLPIVPPGDSERFFALMGELTAWRQELQVSLGGRGERP